MRVGILSVIISLFLSSIAAADTFWSVTGAACSPSEAAIQGDGSGVPDFVILSGHLEHSSSNTDLVSFYCGPITKNDGATNPDALYATFLDSTTTASNYVKVQLIRMTRTSGGLTTIATYDSETDDDASAAAQQSKIGFTHTFDFDTYIYYLRVDMDRSSTSNNEVFYGASLNNDP